MEIGRKSGGEVGFLVLRRRVTCESFQADGKVEEFRKRLKRYEDEGKEYDGKDNRQAVHDKAVYVVWSSGVGVHEKRALRRMSGVM